MIGFDSVQDYIVWLVEQDAAADRELEALLSRRATGPDAGEMRASDFDAIRQRVRNATHRSVQTRTSDVSAEKKHGPPGHR
jgi:Arc/MetJ-type ribon-helix-helix transcriptional regulator